MAGAMRQFSSLNSLKRPARASQRPAPLYEHAPTADDAIDAEKVDSPYYSDDSSIPTSATSRNTSDSYSPMLRKRPSRRSGTRYLYKIPQRTMRYLCLALISTVTIFVLSLMRMSASSARRIETGEVALKPAPPQWEEFPFLKRYYGGIRSIIPRAENVPEYPRPVDEEPLATSVAIAMDAAPTTPPTTPPTKRSSIPKSEAFSPYPDYSSAEYVSTYGTVEECFIDVNGTVRIPRVHAFPGVPQGMPDAIMGSHSVLGLRDDVCFERFGRLGPYGYGYSTRNGGSGAGLHTDSEGAEVVWEEDVAVDFRGVDWKEVQDRCISLNSHRFRERSAPPRNSYQFMPMGADPPPEEGPSHKALEKEKRATTQPSKGSQHVPRTAVIIRTWSDYHYTTEDIIYIRSLISELSLLTGGEYTIHFLIHVRDNNAPIWVNPAVYARTLENALPREFAGMGTLWTEKQMDLLYGGLEESFFRGLPVHGVYRSTFLPLQYFANQHPEFDFFWHWEMDARYTGHWYHLFSSLSAWAKKQPRKGLWERNARFYTPAVHGSWDEFSQISRYQTELGTDSANNIWSSLAASQRDAAAGSGAPHGDKPIWGPEPPLDDTLYTADDPIPPHSHDADKNTWGVGEDADLITLNPLFDPDGTTWVLANDVTGYNTTRALPPRRASIITASRLSARLLRTMHRETSLARHTMFSEMWPATVALHHGFKAVYAPHPTYIDREWPVKYLANVFNAGRNGATGGARTSVFGDREHNFKGSTWYYNAGFAPNLWVRWLGLVGHNDGGEAWEREGEGRMCLPPMLLHPMKGVELIVEEVEGGVS